MPVTLDVSIFLQSPISPCQWSETRVPATSRGGRGPWGRVWFPCIWPVRLQFELTNQDLAGERLYRPDAKCLLTGETLQSGNFSQQQWR